jgi:UDP-glucose:glycoprotein glucosyltransferase
LLRSVSPKIVLYRQLSQESLLSHFSSDPLNRAANESSSETLGIVATEPEIDAWSSSQNPKMHHGKCCWVDVGSELFFQESELKKWLQSTNERWVIKS